MTIIFNYEVRSRGLRKQLKEVLQELEAIVFLQLYHLFKTGALHSIELGSTSLVFCSSSKLDSGAIQAILDHCNCSFNF